MPPTIADVARDAGVGIGTVSRVINHSPLVSQLTRQRVLAAIERLGYRPSGVARAFGGRRTYKLEVLVPLFAAPFFLEILSGLEDVLGDTDYTIVFHTVADARERERVLDACCQPGRADGVLVIWMPPTEAFLARVVEAALPTTLLNAVDSRVFSVAVDHTAAAQRAVTYCLGLGHRRVALIDRAADPFAATPPGVCQAGYRLALADAGLAADPALEVVTAVDARAGADGLERLLALGEPPSAVVVASDTQAIGVLHSARERGWRVPRDLSIVGYNDTDVSQYLGLTTMRVPLRELGRKATEALLMGLVDSNLTPTTTYLPAELVVRKTCGPPAA